MERTAANIRDKWREMGGDNMEARKNGPWSLEEKIELIHLLEKIT
jgi:hypothetical protein